ncbi:MAG: D-amino-acid transaminase [Thiolinea sp.]
MSRIVYVNGEFLPEAEAKISVFDRGFLFADGVYEVSSVLQGKLIDNDGHMVRLHRSMDELEMKAPASDDEILQAQQELIQRNNIEEGLVYLQVTRGAADRDFAYPAADTPSSLVMFTQSKTLIDSPQAKNGIKIASIPDIRWKRRDIKTVGLLAPSMGKMQAKKAGADDAWMVEEGYVTEGTSNNAYIITQDNVLVTRHVGNEILNGITRRAVLKLAEKTELTIEERSFTLEEAYASKEAFVTSATTFVWPVIEIDGHAVADGKPGEFAAKLRELYIEEALAA